MDNYFISELIVLICALIGFVYGMIKCIGLKNIPFLQIVVFAVGCVACGRLYIVVQNLTGTDLSDKFQLGVLGVIGSLLFIFSANFGAVEKIADIDKKKSRKYRFIAAIAPITVLLFYVISSVVVSKSTLELISGGGLTLLVMQSSYYNLKHLLLSGADNGLLAHLRTYNILALIYASLCMAQQFALSINSEIAVLITGTLIGAIMLFIIPAAETGVKKWKT